MERRVLIVESQNESALTMATVLKGAGYQTTIAESAAEARREMDKRRPDVVVLANELPDQSGLVLCGTIRQGKHGMQIPVILVCDIPPEGLQQHAQSPNAANFYLTRPFEMGELARLAQQLAPLTGTENSAGDDMDASLDSALSGEGAPLTPQPSPALPPPIRTTQGGPPRLPKRERRSAITDEDRTFLDRAFQSIADRKAELLAESRELKRTTVRREMMGTPEGKIQILRDELKAREAQIARISEIWSVRERELLSVEDRIHEKDVELQKTKLEYDDMVRRFNDVQSLMVEKEREHGRAIEDLLLQKFIGEKEVIEVVSAKEKDINILRKELAAKDEELTRRGVEIEQARAEYETLEKDSQTATLEFEVREQQLMNELTTRDENIKRLDAELAATASTLQQTVSVRDARYTDYDKQVSTLTATLDETRTERESTVADLTSRLGRATTHGQEADTEIDRLRGQLAELQSNHASRVGEFEGAVADLQSKLEATLQDKAESEQSLSDRVADREARIGHLEAQLADTIERKDRQEAELQAAIQEKLERVGELEGEVEAAKSALSDREAELNAELGDLGAAKEHMEAELSGALNEARQQAAERAERISELESDLGSQRNQNETLTTDLADRDQRIATLADELSRAQEAISTRDGDISALKDEVETLSATLAGKEEALASRTAEYEQTSTQLSETQSALGQTQGNLQAKLAELQQTAEALEASQAALARTRQERTERESEVKAARNEIARITQVQRQTEADKSQLEEQLSGEIAQLKTSLSEAQGNYEAEAAAHKQLDTETSSTIATLTEERDGLAQNLETTQGQLAAVQAKYAETHKAYEHEKAAHHKTQKQTDEEIVRLEAEVANFKENVADLGDQLSATKEELGNRVAELTQVRSQFTQSEDQRSGLEERVEMMLQESKRKDELTQNDIANKSKELADTLRKLTAISQEKARLTEAYTRDNATKTEAVKALELKLKAATDDGKRVQDQLSLKVATLTQDLEASKKHAADAAQASQNAIAAAQHDRDQAKQQLGGQVQTLQARFAEANKALEGERADKKAKVDEASTRAIRAEQRIAQVTQEGTARINDLEAKLKDVQTSLAARTKRIQELEQATEGASLAKARLEKELQARVATAEAKANDSAAKLAVAAKERKDLEARQLKELEDQIAKQKAELERREAMKAQEVQRLQAAVQEKSKQLKVVELELARYKNKPAAAPGATARPSIGSSSVLPPAPKSSPHSAAVSNVSLGEAEEQTGVNAIPTDPMVNKPAVGATSRAPVSVQTGAPAARVPGSTLPPRPASAAPASKTGSSMPAVKKPGIPPSSDSAERTVVSTSPGGGLPPAKKGEEEADFTSLIDSLPD